MTVVMTQHGDGFGQPLPGDGSYLQDFDFEAHGGIGMISLTRDVKKAKRFATMEEAILFYRTSPKCKPTRADGMPNRPLTAATWSFETIED